MILQHLIIENFGLYSGRVMVDLALEKHGESAAPVILIGGRNGAGKTTMLEAIRLALHGKRALGASVSRSSYDDYLRSRLHRDQTAVASSASVAIVFDYGENGEHHRYLVRRSWAAHGTRIADTLEIERDGDRFDAVPSDEWDSFLQDLVPPGVAQLFFFDGEKIQEIADGEDAEGEIADAIRGLLGIELVERLRSDLALYLARHRRSQDSSLADQLEAATRDIAVAEREVARLAEQTADTLTERESRARTAEGLHNRFVAEGGLVALERSRYEEERHHLHRQSDGLRNELRKLANSMGPFLLAPKLMQRLDAAVKNETGIDRRAALPSLEEMAESWVSQKQPQGWTADHREEVRGMLAAWSEAGTRSGAAVLRTLGGRDRGLATIALVEAARVPAAELADTMETNNRALAAAEEALLRVDEVSTEALFEDLKRAERDAGTALEQWRQCDMQLSEARSSLAGRQRDHKRLLAAHEQAAAERNRADLAVRVSAVLGAYEKALLSQKVARLSREFVQCFRELARKPGLIASVDIDASTFRLTLRDDIGREVPRASLSAGEKQIYAISLLWALGRTSGRALPVIIDTPLARLDTVHRRHLVERYFPHASQQVIILSTDAEIDGELHSALSPYLSHSVQLDFDPESGSTRAVRGYFDHPQEARHVVQ